MFPEVNATPGKARKSSLRRPEVSIFLRTGSSVTYTTFDKVEGTVSVNVCQETPFQGVSIQFRGTTSTLVNNNPTSTPIGILQANHPFMKFEQHIPSDAYPTPRILQANRTYNFDFTFQIPQEMRSQACTHPVLEHSVHQAHLQLPPTLGRGRGFEARQDAYDDMAPAMISISYDVIARVCGIDGTIATASENIRVVPCSSVTPPVYTDGNDDYQLREERIIRKGAFRRKSAVITMEADAPEAIPYAEIPHRRNTDDTTAKACIILWFDSTEKGARPPHIGTVKTRLLVANFFASRAHTDIPSAHESMLDPKRGFHATRIKLAPKAYDQVTWQSVPCVAPTGDLSETGSEMKRKDSFASSFSINSRRNSSESIGLCSYVTRLEVPIKLPTNTVLVPTFHNCLVSRTYTIQFLVEIAGCSKLELRVPVQIYNE